MIIRIILLTELQVIEDNSKIIETVLMMGHNICFMDWLVGCFGLNGPLRQYFSLYRASPRESGRKKREMID